MRLRPCEANKLEVQWEGPAEVLKKLSDTNYMVRLGVRRRNVKSYHVNLMKPYVDRQAVVFLTKQVRKDAGRHSYVWGSEK